MTATKTRKPPALDSFPAVAEKLQKISNGLFDRGTNHVYDSAWMKHPTLEQYVAPCGYRVAAPVKDSSETGFILVAFGPDYMDGVFVSIIMPEEKRVNFIPSIDFPGW